MKICPVVAELFHADGRTDMTTVIDFFSKFCERAENDIISGFGSTR